MSDTTRGVLGRYGFMVYAPTTLFSFGEGAILPVLPLIASERGADAWLAALIAGCVVFGQVCGNLPGGWLAARAGERVTMIVSGWICLAASVGIAFLPGILPLAVAAFLLGIGAAGFGIARHAFMTTRVPVAFRARALSLVGGTFRLGMFVGPFASAGLVALTGDQHSGVWILGVSLLLVIALVTFGRDPEREFQPVESDAAREPTPSVAESAAGEDTGEAITASIGTVEGGAGRPSIWATIARYRGVLLTLGVAAASLSAVRGARLIVLPLVGAAIGLDAPTISLVVGISGGIEFALFYASGQVMDRFGRLWGALPPMVIMGIAFLAIALTQGVATAPIWYSAFAMLIGVGNGLSSGVLLTLGADTAPRDEPAPYLGAWRTITDAGGALTPLIVSGLTAAFSLAIATGAIGLLALLGAAAFLRWVPRFIPARE